MSGRVSVPTPSHPTSGRRCVGGWLCSRSPFPEHAQFSVRLLQCDARFQPADDPERVTLECAIRPAELQWRPGVVAEWIPEPFRHDTDHGDRCAAPSPWSPGHRFAPRTSAATRVSQHDDASRARCLIGVEETTTNQWRNTRRVKCASRECRRTDQHGRCVADCQIPELRAVRSETVDRPHIAPPFEKVPSDTELRLVRQAKRKLRVRVSARWNELDGLRRRRRSARGLRAAGAIKRSRLERSDGQPVLAYAGSSPTT